MAQQLRIEYADELYHITSGGNTQEAIYRIDDQTKFLSLVNNIRPLQSHTNSESSG